MNFGRLDLMNDLGAPAIVTAVNLTARQMSTPIMGQSAADLATYIMVGGGYLGAYMGWGGDLVKNIAIASAPLAFEKIYVKVQGVSSRTGSRMSRVSRYPAPAEQAPFQNIRLV